MGEYIQDGGVLFQGFAGLAEEVPDGGQRDRVEQHRPLASDKVCVTLKDVRSHADAL
jgi:hypothetical protein